MFWSFAIYWNLGLPLINRWSEWHSFSIAKPNHPTFTTSSDLTQDMSQKQNKFHHTRSIHKNPPNAGKYTIHGWCGIPIITIQPFRISLASTAVLRFAATTVPLSAWRWQWWSCGSFKKVCFSHCVAGTLCMGRCLMEKSLQVALINKDGLMIEAGVDWSRLVNSRRTSMVLKKTERATAQPCLFQHTPSSKKNKTSRYLWKDSWL